MDREELNNFRYRVQAGLEHLDMAANEFDNAGAFDLPKKWTGRADALAKEARQLQSKAQRLVDAAEAAEEGNPPRKKKKKKSKKTSSPKRRSAWDSPQSRKR